MWPVAHNLAFVGKQTRTLSPKVYANLIDLTCPHAHNSRTHRQTLSHTRMRTRTCTRTCTHAHTHTHTRAHTRAHGCSSEPRGSLPGSPTPPEFGAHLDLNEGKTGTLWDFYRLKGGKVEVVRRILSSKTRSPIDDPIQMLRFSQTYTRMNQRPSSPRLFLAQCLQG